MTTSIFSTEYVGSVLRNTAELDALKATYLELGAEMNWDPGQRLFASERYTDRHSNAVLRFRAAMNTLLMPHTVRSEFSGYHSCKNSKTFQKWLKEIKNRTPKSA
jgi:hypothetical protein